MATIVADKETITTSETLTLATLTGGSQVGKNATDTVGFYGATAVAQQTGADQTALTDNSGGTKSATTGISANMVKQTIIIPVQLSDLGAFTYNVAVPFAFTVTAAGFRPNRLPTTASKAVTATVQVNNASVTGGVLTISTAGITQSGVINNFTAISGANTGTAGQTLGILGSSVTAFVEGDGQFEFTVINTDLANGWATVVAQNTAFRLALVNLGLIRGT